MRYVRHCNKSLNWYLFTWLQTRKLFFVYQSSTTYLCTGICLSVSKNNQLSVSFAVFPRVIMFINCRLLRHFILHRVAGRKVNEDNGLLTLLNLSNALIVNVKNPKPGAWTLRVVSGGESTVRVTGLSPLGFSHGFTRSPTLQLSDTEPRPISGQSSHTLFI